MKRGNIFMSLLTTLLAITVGIFIGMRMSERGRGPVNIIGRQPAVPVSEAKVANLMRMVRTQYVDSVSLDSVAERIMPMIVGELDPHSVYIPAQRYATVNESLEGAFGGIGVKFSMITDTAVVSNVIAGGPSAKAGLESGDRIMTIDTTYIAGRGLDQMKVVEMLRGQLGTKVELGVARQGADSLLRVTVTRGQIAINSITAAFMIVPEVAYLKLGQFSRTSHDEIMAALTRLTDKGARKVVIDLRGNSGGYLDQVIKIANEFLEGDKLIVYTVNRKGERNEHYSNGRGRFVKMEMAVLVDQASASSSEILAGALQDNDRGVIVGRRTFGKGLVQEQVQFADGSAVRLTVARYYTPSGRSIQKPYDNAEEYRLETLERYMNNEYFSADSIHFADSLRYKTVGGRTVYGGGGIMPDIFVPLDTTYMNNFYMAAQTTALPYRFALRYADAHRIEVNAVRSVKGLDSLLNASPTLFDDFVKYAAALGLRSPKREVEQTREVLTRRLRADIGRDTALEDAGFFSQYWPVDDPLRLALEKLLEKN